MKIQVSDTEDRSAITLESMGRKNIVWLLRRTFRQALPELFLVEGEQDVRVVDIVERDGGLVF